MLKPYPLLKLDAYAWCLSIGLPVIWIPFAIFFPKEIALGLYMVISLIWVLLDRLNLMKQEITPPSMGWFLLPMVYLRQRDERQGKPWRLLQVWLICTVLSAVAGNHFKTQSNTERLAQSACPLVTKILQRQGIEEHCIRITDIRQEVVGRFYQAQALLNTGSKEPLTIEVRSGGNIYVTLTDSE